MEKGKQKKKNKEYVSVHVFILCNEDMAAYIFKYIYVGKKAVVDVRAGWS